MARHWLAAACLLLTLAGAVVTRTIAEDVVDAQTPAAAAKDKDSKRLKEDEYYELYRSLADTLDQVERNYVKEVSRRELMEAAIKGIVGKLDPYSSYIGPEELGGFKTSVESQFGGIGIQITIDAGQLRVLSPLVGTPAYRAGIQAGDRIVKIEGDGTSNITIDEAVRRLKGEVGTSVTLTIMHPGSSKQETLTLKREIVHVETVMGDSRRDDDAWEFMLDKDKKIGYIRVTAFSRDTANDVKKALTELTSRKLNGLIVDLRFNPGGLLTSAVEISDLFISDGRIVSTEGRNTPKRTWEAVKEGTFDGFPMVVLVNRYSASASEIVAACLQDHGRAIVVGERTWGKGSVQNVIELESGKSALKLTTASYQRPNGQNIHRFPDAKESDVWGVKPNEGYDLKLSDSDLSKLMSHRRMRDILVAHKKADKDASDKEESKSGEKKDATGDAEKTDAEKSGEDKSDKEDKSDVKSKDKTAAKPEVEAAKSPEYVDRQLQKALEYLSSELARAK